MVTATSSDQRPRAPERRQRRVTAGAAAWLPLMLFPICIGLGVVYFAAVQGLALGFTDWNLIAPARWVGLENFRAIIADPRFWTSLKNTLIIVALTVPAKVVVGLALAVAMNRVPRFGDLFRLALFFPVSCSVVAVAFIWQNLYDVDGVLNTFRAALGMSPVNWLSTDYALMSISVMIVWAGMGYVALLFVAGLQSIPTEYYDAATVDGAGAFTRFRYVTFPLLTPTTFFVLVTSLITAFQTFGEVFVLQGPVDSTLTIMAYIYERAFTGFQMGYAAALSAFLIIIILLVTVVQLRVQRRWVNYDI